jgi:hypothetical protein
MIRKMILGIACCLMLFSVGYGQKGETKPEWPGPDCIPEYWISNPMCLPGIKPADTITDDCKCNVTDDCKCHVTDGCKSNVTDDCNGKGDKCRRRPFCEPIDLLIGSRNQEW